MRQGPVRVSSPLREGVQYGRMQPLCVLLYDLWGVSG